MKYPHPACLILLLLLGACSSLPGDGEPTISALESTATTMPTSTSSPTLTPANHSPSPTPSPESLVSPTAGRQEPIIVLKQEGGFAGVMLQWVIYNDGRIIAEGSGPGAVSGHYQADPGPVAELMNTLEELGLFQQRPAKANPVCCDFFTFTLTVRRDDQETTLSFSDGDESAPERFRLAIAAVHEFLEMATTGADTQ